MAVSGFGLESTTSRVNVTEDGRRRDVVVERAPAVEVVSDAPTTIEPGASFELSFRVAGVETYTPTIVDGSLEGVEIAEFELGVPRDVSHLERGETFTATVRTAPDELGSLALAHEFDTVTNETIRRRTARTDVVVDPITVGPNGTVPTVRDALAVAVEGSTIELLDGTHRVDVTATPLRVNETVTVTAADGAEPRLAVDGSPGSEDLGILLAADGVVVSGVAVDATDVGVALGVSGDAVRLDGIDVRGGTRGVAVAGSVDRLANLTVAGSETALAVSGTVTELRDSVLHGAVTGLAVEGRGRTEQVRNNAFAGNGTAIALARGSVLRTLEANDFAGEVGVDAEGAAFLTRRNDFADVNGAAIRNADGGIVSRFDYFGDRGPTGNDLVGSVEAPVFLTEPPGAVSDRDEEVQHFGYHVELAANETTAVAFPGPLANDLETTFGAFDGTVYSLTRFGWRPVTDGDHVPDALDAYVVTPEENVTVLVEFEPSEHQGTPGEARVRPGWNLVGAPSAGSIETAFAPTRPASPLQFLNPLAAPTDLPYFTPADDEWLTYTVGSDAEQPTVDPHAGYFVYATDRGGIAASTYPGMTFGEFRELLLGELQRNPGGPISDAGSLRGAADANVTGGNATGATPTGPDAAGTTATAAGGAGA